MNIISPSLYYIHFRTIAKVLYLHCIRYFSVRRFIVAWAYLLIMFILGVFIFIFRLADEIFFRAYRKIEIKAPVYIIANPRSGTTFLHRLICKDEDRFVHIRMYHTIIPAITFYKMINGLGSLDKHIGRPLQRGIQWMDKKLFRGWEDIHPAGFNRSEEDEGLYFMAGISPAISLVTPYMQHFRELYIPDHLSEKKRERIKKYYKSTLQRWMYVLGQDKQFLCKSVMSTGRLQLLTDMFPDIRIIYLLRNPYEAVPSFVKMFASTWKFTGHGISENSSQSRELASLAIRYYQYFNEQQNKIQSKNLISLKYEDLVSNPAAVVHDIYNHFQYPLHSDFDDELLKAASASKGYKSKFHYSLDQYGLTKEEIRKELPFVFEEYDFQ